MSGGLPSDERGIEGLPIRLVIALVVGVACLAVMMSVLGGFDGVGSTELDTDPEPGVVAAGQHHEVAVTVLDPDGDTVQNATVIASGDTAQLDALSRAETGENGTATLSFTPELGANQQRGRVTLDVRPPSDGDYVDDRSNTGVLVIED
jgi:hypothetical protein